MASVISVLSLLFLIGHIRPSSPSKFFVQIRVLECMKENKKANHSTIATRITEISPVAFRCTATFSFVSVAFPMFLSVAFPMFLLPAGCVSFWKPCLSVKVDA